MLTASPSAVKLSTVVPSPVAPTNATPVWTAVPTGMDTNDVVLARAGRSARSMAAATATEEEATQPGERSRADLAAWREWHSSEDPPLPG